MPSIFGASCWSESCSVMSNSLRPHGLYSPWNFPGQNTGVGSLSLLQETFPTQGLNQGLPNCRRILYQPTHQRSPRILEWVTYPFSRGSSRARNWTGSPALQADSLPTSRVAQSVKHLPAMRETWVQFLGQEDPLEKEMATHSSILAWRIPWTEEPGRLQFMGWQELDTT